MATSKLCRYLSQSYQQVLVPAASHGNVDDVTQTAGRLQRPDATPTSRRTLISRNCGRPLPLDLLAPAFLTTVSGQRGHLTARPSHEAGASVSVGLVIRHDRINRENERPLYHINTDCMSPRSFIQYTHTSGIRTFLLRKYTDVGHSSEKKQQLS